VFSRVRVLTNQQYEGGGCVGCIRYSANVRFTRVLFGLATPGLSAWMYGLWETALRDGLLIVVILSCFTVEEPYEARAIVTTASTLSSRMRRSLFSFW